MEHVTSYSHRLGVWPAMHLVETAPRFRMYMCGTKHIELYCSF